MQEEINKSIQKVQVEAPLLFPRLMTQHRAQERAQRLDDYMTMWDTAQKAGPLKLYDADTGQMVNTPAAPKMEQPEDEETTVQPEDEEKLSFWDWLIAIAGTILVLIGTMTLLTL